MLTTSGDIQVDGAKVMPTCESGEWKTCLGILVGTMLESTTNSALGLEELCLDRLYSWEVLMGSEEVLQSDESRGSSAKHSDLHVDLLDGTTC